MLQLHWIHGRIVKSGNDSPTTTSCNCFPITSYCHMSLRSESLRSGGQHYTQNEQLHLRNSRGSCSEYHIHTNKLGKENLNCGKENTNMFGFVAVCLIRTK